MAANVYLRTISISSSWQKLADTSTVVNVTIVPVTNTNVRFRGGTSASWPGNVAVKLEGVDLADLEVRGVPGSTMFVIGHTR
ncbi:MAG: hypothetical protein GY842_27560 [bacterium]|nr:hypothetical protein [bacterium]